MAGPLCSESLPVAVGFPSERTSDEGIWCFLWCQSEQNAEQTVQGAGDSDILTPIWRGCNRMWSSLCLQMSEACQRLISRTISLSNSTENSSCTYAKCNAVIARKFCTWHDSCTVVACAKFCSDMNPCNGVTLKPSFHRIWITMENRSWNGPLITNKHSEDNKGQMFSLKFMWSDNVIPMTKASSKLLTIA